MDQVMETLRGLFTEYGAKRMDLASFLRQLNEVVAAHLEVGRTGIWLYNAAQGVMTCADQFDADRNEHTRGTTLYRDDSPDYFAALESERRIVAPSVAKHPAMTSLIDTYYDTVGVEAALDIGIVRDGALIGAFRCEQVGGERLWTEGDAKFAEQIANIVAKVR